MGQPVEADLVVLAGDTHTKRRGQPGWRDASQPAGGDDRGRLRSLWRKSLGEHRRASASGDAARPLPDGWRHVALSGKQWSWAASGSWAPRCGPTSRHMGRITRWQPWQQRGLVLMTIGKSGVAAGRRSPGTCAHRGSIQRIPPPSMRSPAPDWPSSCRSRLTKKLWRTVRGSAWSLWWIELRSHAARQHRKPCCHCYAIPTRPNLVADTGLRSGRSGPYT
jgi:hypothetical protein